MFKAAVTNRRRPCSSASSVPCRLKLREKEGFIPQISQAKEQLTSRTIAQAGSAI